MGIDTLRKKVGILTAVGLVASASVPRNAHAEDLLGDPFGLWMKGAELTWEYKEESSNKPALLKDIFEAIREGSAQLGLYEDKHGFGTHPEIPPSLRRAQLHRKLIEHVNNPRERARIIDQYIAQFHNEVERTTARAYVCGYYGECGPTQ